MAQRPQRLRTHGNPHETQLAEVVDISEFRDRAVENQSPDNNDQDHHTETLENAGPMDRRQRRRVLGATVAGSLAVTALSYIVDGGGDHERPEPTISSIDAATIGIENPDGLDSGVVRGGQLMVDAPEAPIAPPNPSQAP